MHLPQRLASVAALVSCLTPICVRATETELLQMEPTSAWVADYAEDSCALRRAFAAGDEQVILQLRQYGPGETIEVVILSDTLQAVPETPRVRFEPGDSDYKPTGAFRLKAGKGDVILYRDSLRPHTPNLSPEEGPQWSTAERDAREQAITGLAVYDAFEKPLFLQTGQLHGPMHAMRACLDELLEHWGLDADVQRTLTRRAKPLDPKSWMRRAMTYPTELLRQGRSGFADIRLIVGADGKPSSCIANKDAPDRAFDDHTCRQYMRYARFEPALDASGQPTASFWTTTVVYGLR